MKEKIRRFYKFKLWTRDMVEMAAIKNVISWEDAEEILSIEQID
jgi:hypothetical protein